MALRLRRRALAQVHEGRHPLRPEVRREVRVAPHRVNAVGGHVDKGEYGTDELIRIT